MQTGDTIVAISSAVGEAPRMIVRLSGADAVSLAAGVCDAASVQPGAAERMPLKLGGVTVPVWIYCFESPRSATGEDVIEIHLPGNALLSKMLVDKFVARGARLAEPGEFTARGYFNGKLDLTEAEGVAATIAAQNERQLAASRQLLAGELARRLQPVMQQLAEALALIEAGIDFSEEDISFITAADLKDRISRADQELSDLLSTSHRFESLPAHPTVVLVGRPNAGKSTLLNRLAGTDRAVVSPVAGTTRDALSAAVALPRGMVTIYDVAGLESESKDDDEIERSMRDTALKSLKTADFVVLLIDANDPRPKLLLPRDPDLVVHTKTPTGEGYQPPLEELKRLLSDQLFGSWSGGEKLALNSRHVAALEEARSRLRQAGLNASDGMELVALGLREAIDQIGGVIGHVTPDDIVGRIFAQFCIGK